MILHCNCRTIRIQDRNPACQRNFTSIKLSCTTVTRSSLRAHLKQSIPPANYAPRISVTGMADLMSAGGKHQHRPRPPLIIKQIQNRQSSTRKELGVHHTMAQKIILKRIAHVYYVHEDLEKANQFLLDFGKTSSIQPRFPLLNLYE
jgi:hypothetical protein